MSRAQAYPGLSRKASVERIVEQDHEIAALRLRFLDDPQIEPTNNRAERALRPAMIARKVSHCSKTMGGAQTFAAFTSVLRTLAKTHSGTLVDGLVHVFCFAQLPPPSESR